jgi:hypothetical protein
MGAAASAASPLLFVLEEVLVSFQDLPTTSPPQVVRRVPTESRRSESRPGNRDQLRPVAAGAPFVSNQGGCSCWDRVGVSVAFLLFVHACSRSLSSVLVLVHWVPFCTRNKSISTAWHTHFPQDRFHSFPLGLGRHKGMGPRSILLEGGCVGLVKFK